MPSGLLEAFKASIAGDLASVTARRYGERESGLSDALRRAGTRILHALAQRARDVPLMTRVAGMIIALDDPAVAAPVPSSGARPIVSARDPSGTVHAGPLGQGTALLSLLFGDQLQSDATELAQATKISNAAARGALGLAAVNVLRTLATAVKGDTAGENGVAPPVTGAAVGRRLASEAATIEREALAATTSDAASTTRRPTAPLADAAPVRPSQVPGLDGLRGLASGPLIHLETWFLDGWGQLVTLLVMLVLWWLFLPGLYTPQMIGQRGSPAPRSESSSTVSRTQQAVTGLMHLIRRTLPTSRTIEFAEKGVEDQLIALIEERNAPIERSNWFDFDRLNFQTGSANLTPESRAQVENIADILRAYPNVRIKLGGFTDNVGDADANQRLSEARAQRVMTELITTGISALRLEAEGYGERFPIADNATSEGRARNRRTSVRLLAR